MGENQKKKTTEGATGLGRITREPIEKRNKMTALRFQTGWGWRRDWGGRGGGGERRGG